MPLCPIEVDLIDAGGLIEEINAALAKICKDVVDRPHTKKARELTLKITLEPNLDAKINAVTNRYDNYPKLEWSVAIKVPGASGMTTRAFVHDNKVCINPRAPGETNPNQLTLDDVTPEPRENKNIVSMG